jgi:hypothetical protein
MAACASTPRTVQVHKCLSLGNRDTFVVQRVNLPRSSEWLFARACRPADWYCYNNCESTEKIHRAGARTILRPSPASLRLGDITRGGDERLKGAVSQLRAVDHERRHLHCRRAPVASVPAGMATVPGAAGRRRGDRRSDRECGADQCSNGAGRPRSFASLMASACAIPPGFAPLSHNGPRRPASH